MSRVIVTQAASHCVTPTRAAKPAYQLILMICWPAAWQDDATTTNGEVWSCQQCACLRHCLGQGLGSGMQRGRPVTARMAGAVERDGFGTGRAAAAARFCVPARGTRFTCFCRIYVVICSDVRVGVVQCGLVTPAW